MRFNYAVMTFMALICIATIGMMIFGAVRNNNGLLEMGFDLATIAVSGTIGALAVQLGAQRLDLLANCICGWGTRISRSIKTDTRESTKYLNRRKNSSLSGQL